MAITAYHYRMTYMLAVRNNMTLEQAYLFIQTYKRDPRVIALLDEIMAEQQWVVMLREPTNNLESITLCRIRKYKFDDDTISIPPEPLGGLNADLTNNAGHIVRVPCTVTCMKNTNSNCWDKLSA